jgi:hypothetical protein
MMQPGESISQETTAKSADPSPARQHSVLSFSEFLVSLLKAFEAEGIRPCIMRNYEGFPDQNIGRDMDFVISPSELPKAIRALDSIKGVRVVGYIQYPFVALVYLSGVSPAPQVRSLEVDFSWRLDWKGLPFLATDVMMQAAVRQTAGNSVFFKLSPVHEAILSLLTCLLSSGFVKEKYFPMVQRTFTDERSQVIAALVPHFGSTAATRLVDFVIEGDRRKIVGCAGSLRAALVLRSVLRRPLRSILDVVWHYAGGFAVHYSPKTRESICILGFDGCGKTTTIESLMATLQGAAMVVEKRHPGSRSSLVHDPSEAIAPVNSNPGALRGPLVSMVKLIVWVLEEWLSQIKGSACLVLRLKEGCYHDLPINPRRYGYGGPIWFARLATKLLPSPDLWILLDVSPELLRSGNLGLSPVETLRQVEAYRAFVRTRRKYVIVSADQSAQEVTERSYAFIIDILAERANRRLRRFL